MEAPTPVAARSAVHWVLQLASLLFLVAFCLLVLFSLLYLTMGRLGTPDERSDLTRGFTVFAKWVLAVVALLFVGRTTWSWFTTRGGPPRDLS